MSVVDALTFAVFGICVVFAALAVLMCLLLLWGKLAVVLDRKAGAAAVPEGAEVVSEDEEQSIDPKIRAIIMAAVAAELRRSPDGLQFVSIKRVRG